MRIVFLGLLLLTSVSRASSTPPPPARSPATTAGNPRATPQPAAAPSDQASSPSGESALEDDSGEDESTTVFSLGGGGYSLWRRGVTDPFPADPAVILELRQIRHFSTYVGLEWTSTLTVQDFETVGRVYEWYFRESEDRATKLLLLWPGLILAPLAGSNFSSGAGLNFVTSGTKPRLYLDFGMQFVVFLRPSEEDVDFDIGAASYAGVGAELSEHVGLGLRASYALPLFHGLSDDFRPRAVTAAALVNLSF